MGHNRLLLTRCCRDVLFFAMFFLGRSLLNSWCGQLDVIFCFNAPNKNGIQSTKMMVETTKKVVGLHDTYADSDLNHRFW